MRHQTIPTDRTLCNRAEIVEEIIDNLRPWTRPESEVEANIQQAIESLQKRFRSTAPRASRSAIKKWAQEAGAAFAEAEESLRRVPPSVALFEEPPPPFEQMSPLAPSSEEAFRNELKRLRIVFERLARYPGGSHPNFDHAKWECGRCAFELVRNLSQRTPTGTTEGPFRTIASLLFQAISGKRQDLKRACDGVVGAEKKARERWTKAGWIQVAGGKWLPPPSGWPDGKDAPLPF
jgi:hypothetical protein